ncbi:type I-U CRISPR-associated helicase/endonuclease Cas3 [Streptomyces radicis]|uniref:Type I-U CRISPR-associated helicase/endonuclease Cas3 n=1 Tax=Streptomyces radicis TaxID=1750517 RepID=A0A3A9W1N8_9ACTN|nr:type I-U CRISPR-associated helicase/endonuclease Cas3 [Streptomyces radicis]RKN03114.1 type I-U CRISPR-associated helicase/endonuclease Cas3 [Streptomyces radicis]RKN13042.1 type I-U CRISPR-associated helicase/endonuclease Cas3 [Streptomyces radicis]
MTLELDDFEAFFDEVYSPCTKACPESCGEHGKRPQPFEWQKEYVRQVAADGVWADLDIPTGLGKTSLIDIWTFLLAWQLSREESRTVPLRLFFVVDRRLVVDQAHDHARRLADRLARAEEGSVLAMVASALCKGRDDGGPLDVVRMRGGVDWASRWLDSPAQPAVVTATVDQYGSRLLFRGYHTSARMRPIDAALCGTDALLAVDEAHIALPLLTTASDCAAYQAAAPTPALADRAVKVVSLSATARTTPDRPSFGLPAADWEHPTAEPRLRVKRQVTTIDAAGVSKTAADAFATAAGAAVDALLKVVERPVIGVVANTIPAARAAHQRLAGRSDLDTLLLTGRCRPAEREQLLDSPPLRELTGGRVPHRERPLVVVATQTVEVGWDVSFAGLCTEVASLDSLVQRLGRVDRRGELARAPVAVVRCHAPKRGDEHTIPVYGAAAARTWEWLISRPSTPPTVGTADKELAQNLASSQLVLNPATIPGLLGDLEEADREALSSPTPPTPRVHATLLDSFARTQPAPYGRFDQDLAPLLHGATTAEADVQVAWRADLPPAAELNRTVMPPPHAQEMVSLPASYLRRFLSGQRISALSDLEGKDEVEAGRGRLPCEVVRWHPRDSGHDDQPWEVITDLSGIVPGGTYLLPAAAGGHDEFGFTGRLGTGGRVPDLGDFPPRASRATTRLDARVLASQINADETEQEAMRTAIAVAARQLTSGTDDEGEEISPAAVIDALLALLLEATRAERARPVRSIQRLAERLRHLKKVPSWEISTPRPRTAAAQIVIDGPDRLLLTAPLAGKQGGERLAGISDDGPDTSSLTVEVPLSKHSTAVAKRAHHFADLLGLPKTLATALQQAAEAHDCGKAHPRFQCMLCGGDALMAESLEAPLAKSTTTHTDRATRRRAARLANWPQALRHEALSAAAVRTWLATTPPTALGTDHELITHLVAAHHGHARPLLPPVTDPDPVEVTCTMPDGQTVTVNSSTMGTDWSGHARFTALNHRYGPWGLALLETIIRLADMACSEEGT